MIVQQTAASAAGTARESSRPLDEQAFEAFYRQNGRSLMTYLTRLCGSASLAEDLFQKTFFLFLRANPALGSEDERRAYLYRVATNVMHDHWRRVKREGEHGPLDESIAAPAPAGSGEDVQKVLRELNPKERALLWFAHVEELGHREIAERLGVQEKSVKVLLFRARKRIAAVLQQYGMVPGGSR